MSSLYHLCGRLYWHDVRGAVYERDDDEGLPLDGHYGLFLERARASSLDDAWLWIDGTDDATALLDICEEHGRTLNEIGRCDECSFDPADDGDRAYDSWKDAQGELEF